MKKGNVILICLLLGTGFSVIALWKSVGVYSGIRSRSWPSVGGTVVRTTNDQYPATALEYVRVKYQYRVDGNSYQSERLSFSAFDSRLDRAALATKSGQEVRVCYNPNRPSESVLYPGANFIDYALTLTFWAFAGLALYAARRVQKDFLQ